jgi:hypothetical protein
MDKQIQFFGKTETGVFCQALFGSAGTFEKVAGAPPFADWETGEELRRYINKLSSIDRKDNVYVLVNALGAGEYFGSNINADYFPWDALSHKGDDYGYLTFLNAHAYQHHKNKDPTRAFGTPVLSTLNPKMKRVELIIRLNREKAQLEGADGIIARIDRGEFPDVSMGCKVPYDICSICKQQSKTRFDYCSHMHPPEELRSIYGPNKVLPDGRKIYVVNTLPRFFDISFVFIGADKTAKVMAKVASKGKQICLGDVCTIPRPSAEIADIVRPLVQVPQSYEKVASAHQECECGGPCCNEVDSENENTGYYQMLSGTKVATSKISEIIKNVPAGPFSTKVLPRLEKEELDIPSAALTALGEKLPLSETASSAAMMGIVLKPHEFQRLVLSRIGKKDFADKLDRDHKIFREVNEFDDSLKIDKAHINPEVIRGLLGLLKDRSAFGEPFKVRIITLRISNKPLPTQTPIKHPLLDKISAAYNGYRRSVLEKVSQAMEVVNSDPKLKEVIIGKELLNMFSKTASTPIVSFDSVAYLMGAHFQNRGLLTDVAIQKLATNNGWLEQSHESA